MTVMIIKGEEAKYVRSGGVYCPWCKSGDLTGAGFDVDGGTATQDIICQSCGKTWSDVYKLIGYDANYCGPE